jgi:hypothetical protein
LNPNADTFVPNAAVASSAAHRHQGLFSLAARNITGHLSTQTYETDPSQYIRSGNEAMIFSNHLLTPTRGGDFASFGKPKVVHPPSMMSMSASIFNLQSPTGSILSVIPEVQASKELQAALADDVEKQYNETATTSKSDESPLSTNFNTTTTPHIPRSRSVPNLFFFTLNEDAPASLPVRRPLSADNTNVFLDDSVLSALPLPLFAPPAAADDGSLHAAITSSHRALQSDLVVLHQQLNAAEHQRDEAFAVLENRVAGIERKLDLLIEMVAVKSTAAAPVLSGSVGR